MSAIPQKGWTRKEGRGNKDFKKGGDNLGQGGGVEPPYEL